MTPEQYTLGIEEEFQIVDPQTRELRSHVSAILEEGRRILGEQVKPEMIQSQVEVGTGICRNIAEARADITNLRSVISMLARNNELRIVAASTHPISHWSEQRIFDDAHYTLLIEELPVSPLVSRGFVTGVGWLHRRWQLRQGGEAGGHPLLAFREIPARLRRLADDISNVLAYLAEV